MRFPQRPGPGLLATPEKPRPWCVRCGGTRYAVRVWGSTRHVYACPKGCDDFDPRRGEI